jgi:hypothetical protein
VFKNRVLRRIFGPRRKEVTGECKQLYNEELDYLYSSPNIIWVIKLRRMRRAGHVAGMSGGVYRVLVGERERKRPPEIPGVDRIILSWIFRKWDGGTGLD